MQNNDNNTDNMEQFSTDFRTVTFLKEISNENAITEKPRVGDLVQIINRNFLIEVTHANYDFKTVMNTEYAGVAQNNECENIILFNQEDILKIVRQNEKIR